MVADPFQSSLGIKKECTLCKVEREGLMSGLDIVMVARCLRMRSLSIDVLLAAVWELKWSVGKKGKVSCVSGADNGCVMYV